MPVILNDHLKTTKRKLLMNFSAIKTNHLEKFLNASYLYSLYHLRI